MKHIVFDCDGTLLDTSTSRYRLFPGIEELIKELSQEHTLYVWTARGRASTLRILQELEIAQYFDGFCTPDDAPSKPHVAGLLQLLNNTPKASICMIGDTSNDMIGARNFGIMAIGALWNGEANADLLRDYGADFIVSHPDECSKLIRQNLKGDEHV